MSDALASSLLARKWALNLQSLAEGRGFASGNQFAVIRFSRQNRQHGARLRVVV